MKAKKKTQCEICGGVWEVPDHPDHPDLPNGDTVATITYNATYCDCLMYFMNEARHFPVTPKMTKKSIQKSCMYFKPNGKIKEELMNHLIKEWMDEHDNREPDPHALNSPERRYGYWLHIMREKKEGSEKV